jgi:hypothetical protein
MTRAILSAKAYKPRPSQTDIAAGDAGGRIFAQTRVSGRSYHRSLPDRGRADGFGRYHDGGGRHR